MNIYKPRINLQKHGRLLVHKKPYPLTLLVRIYASVFIVL